MPRNLAVTCPTCHQPPTHPCTNKAGRPAPPHLRRISAARIAREHALTAAMTPEQRAADRAIRTVTLMVWLAMVVAGLAIVAALVTYNSL